MTPSDRDKLTRRMLKQYQKLRHARKEAEDDIRRNQMLTDYGKPRVQGGRGGDAVSMAAFAHMDAARLSDWVTAIDAAMAELDEFYPQTAEILRRHFRMRFTAGYRHTHVKKVRDAICEVQHISKTEYYVFLSTGVNVVQFYAAEQGLFRNNHSTI